MTVIAAMDCGDYLLLAADSEISHDGEVRSFQKNLAVLDGTSIAWGFSGAEELALEFGHWLNAYSWTTADWRKFKDDAADELSRGARLDNVCLVPGNLLPYREQYQEIANGLPAGSVLICLPPAETRQRMVLEWVASNLRADGYRVTTLLAERFA